MLDILIDNSVAYMTVFQIIQIENSVQKVIYLTEFSIAKFF